MTAFLSNEPDPQLGVGSAFMLPTGEAILSLTKSAEIKVPIDDWVLLTPSLFFGGKTGLVSSTSCLNYSFGFTVYDLLHSLVG